MSFLTAEWRKLAIANYAINPQLLQQYVPAGTELDLWEGKCYVSLIGFMFTNVKLLGIKIPFHTNFEEVNLRFYVKRLEDGEWKRGVVFIKEIVPKAAITLVANTIYNENYETLPMRHQWKTAGDKRHIQYEWKKNQKWNLFRVATSLEATDIPVGSKTEFITEHYWGYAKKNATHTNEYEVTHPRWKAYQVHHYTIDVDFGSLYGAAFDFLSQATPDSVMLAEGSAITIESKQVIN